MPNEKCKCQEPVHRAMYCHPWEEAAAAEAAAVAADEEADEVGSSRR